jgi:glycosyltransferase involved in cell wall biosynthesis
MTAGRVLHVLSQRPQLTGSGITLDALVRHGRSRGWTQRVAVGVPADSERPDVGGLAAESVSTLHFGAGELAFPVPGMSDVMPYPSTRFGSMTPDQLSAYVRAWRHHLEREIAQFSPELIHTHHVWIVSSLLKQMAPNIPVVTHCHATGLRQMELCPHLEPAVRAGCSRIEAFLVLVRAHGDQIVRRLGVGRDRVRVVGAGYRDELFHAAGRREPRHPKLIYIGKYSPAKGLHCLLDAFERLLASHPELELHLAGSGSGPQATALAARADALAPAVVQHGMLAQAELAALLRGMSVCVLPSFYEGLPLVLVEALASGCRLVATALPGIVEQLAPQLGEALELVPLPPMQSVDRPLEAQLPGFVERLRTAIAACLDKPPLGQAGPVRGQALAPFTWSAVFERVEAVWLELLASSVQRRG